jgi:hypothetical protein
MCPYHWAVVNTRLIRDEIYCVYQPQVSTIQTDYFTEQI